MCKQLVPALSVLVWNFVPVRQRITCSCILYHGVDSLYCVLCIIELTSCVRAQRFSAPCKFT